jgi:hypothetical protein
MHWIKSNLARELNLSREARSKLIAYKRDLELVLQAIWSFDSVAAMKSTHTTPSVSILTNALVCCAKGR